MLFRPAARSISVRTCILALAASASLATPALAAGGDVVLYPTDVATMSGNWARVQSASGAGITKMQSNDYGWSAADNALSNPNDYFEATFTAPAYVKYHVWVRLRGTNDSKYNESVWVQFSDALDRSGNTVYPIGSNRGMLVNLENCSNCGVSGWGWQDKAYWLQQENIVQFPSSGTHRVRVQTREDGVQVDQIVLSAATYMSSSPGSTTNDSTILPQSSDAGTSSTSNTSGTASIASSSSLAYNGSPVTLPGTVSAEKFDTGADGVSYHDTTSGNSGGAFRQTNVDLESSSEGAYDIGWIDRGEWLNYTVNVSAAGNYTARLRVASPSGGGALHIGFNTASNVWKSVSIPATGSWQTWTYVDVPVTLGAGVQQMTLLFDAPGFNLKSVALVSGSSSSTSSGSTTTSPTPAPSTSTSGGTSVPVATWNVQVNDSSASHARTVIDYLTSLSPQPQVVVIEEAHRAQYSTYLNELQSRTGRSWNGAMLGHCAPGAWNGSTCNAQEDEGVAVFSSFPVVDSGTKWLPYADAYHSARASVRLAINVNGITTQVFGVHLQVGNATARNNSMSMLKSWASGYAAPQIAAGDFNADMDQIDTYSGMMPNFVDSWSQAGSGRGYTASTPSPTMKLDYWFGDAQGRAKVEWVYVHTGTGTASDHYPVIASYSIK